MALSNKIGTTVTVPSISGKSIVIPGNVLFQRLWGKNIGAATFYIHVIDAAVLPADGAVTHVITPLEVGAGFEFNINLDTVPIIFLTGICIYASSTDNIKTLVLGNDFVATLQYAELEYP